MTLALIFNACFSTEDVCGGQMLARHSDGRSYLAAAASSITFATSFGCETMTT
jgi:hypothetical protein